MAGFYMKCNTGIIWVNMSECIIPVVIISLVISREGDSSNGCFKKTKHVKFSEKRIRTRVTNVHFSENLACSVFLQLLF